jgi:hypothetical protein
MTKQKVQCRITRSQAFALAAVLAKHDTKNMRWAEIEALACEATGLKMGQDISRDTVKNVMEDAKLPLPEKKYGLPGNEAKLDRTSALAKYVRYIYEKLGEPVPDGLADLCNRNATVRGQEQSEQDKPATEQPST